MNLDLTPLPISSILPSSSPRRDLKFAFLIFVHCASCSLSQASLGIWKHQLKFNSCRARQSSKHQSRLRLDTAKKELDLSSLQTLYDCWYMHRRQVTSVGAKSHLPMLWLRFPKVTSGEKSPISQQKSQWYGPFILMMWMRKMARQNVCAQSWIKLIKPNPSGAAVAQTMRLCQLS